MPCGACNAYIMAQRVRIVARYENRPAWAYIVEGSDRHHTFYSKLSRAAQLGIYGQKLMMNRKSGKEDYHEIKQYKKEKKK